MKFLFLGGGPSTALHDELRELGHKVLSTPKSDWYDAGLNGKTPEEWADGAALEVVNFRPDVLVLHKGWAWFPGHKGIWVVPPAFLGWATARVRASLYLCADDPAGTPITLLHGLHLHFDAWLTTCPGIVEMFPEIASVHVEEFWLAQDGRQPLTDVDPSLEVDVAMTGTPYYRPFPEPHYQHGFSCPRRDIVLAAIDQGHKVGVWGPPTWLDREHGGDPRIEPVYRGWIDTSRVHVVHRSAKVTIATNLVDGRRYESGKLWCVGAGGCLLMEEREGLREEFGERVAWFPPGDVGAAMRELGALLGDDARRERMRQEGRAFVLARHSWRERAVRMAEIAHQLLRPAR